MESTIRLIKYNELEDLLELYKHLNSDDPELEKNNDLRSLWKQIYHNPDMHYIVTELQGQIIASCVLVIVQNLTRNARPYGLIEDVVTHSNHRRKGYGKAVLLKALDIAWNKKCYKVMLLTGSKKERTLKFYESVGFKQGVKTGFVATP
jgi:GNAT superfamily N-acetyltransferase